MTPRTRGGATSRHDRRMTGMEPARQRDGPASKVGPDRSSRPLHRDAFPGRPRRLAGASRSCSGSSRRASRHALSGAGWEATGSQSVQARAADRPRTSTDSPATALMTVLYSPTKTVNDPAFRAVIARVERTLRADARRQHRPRAGRRRVDLALTGTPRSCRPAPPATPTRWSRPPTASRASSARCRLRRRAGAPHRRVGDVV